MNRWNSKTSLGLFLSISLFGLSAHATQPRCKWNLRDNSGQIELRERLRIDPAGAIQVGGWSKYNNLTDLKRVVFINLGIGYAIEDGSPETKPGHYNAILERIRSYATTSDLAVEVSGGPNPDDNPVLMATYAIRSAQRDLAEILSETETQVRRQSSRSERFRSMTVDHQIEFSNLLHFQELSLLYALKEQKRDLHMANSPDELKNLIEKAVSLFGLISHFEQEAIPKWDPFQDAQKYSFLSTNLVDLSRLLKSNLDQALGPKATTSPADRKLLAKYYRLLITRIARLGRAQFGEIGSSQLGFKNPDGKWAPLFTEELSRLLAETEFEIRQLTLAPPMSETK